MKERLTGAIILVGLIVVLVPELLIGPIRPASHAHGPASSAEEPPLRSYTISLADEAHGGSGALQPQPSAAPSPMAPAAEPAGAAPAAPKPAAAPAERTPPVAAPPPARPTPAREQASAPPPSAAPAAGASASGYMVQLGSFANRANAERLARQVHGLGFPVSVSRGSSGRRLYRVQAGPAHERAAAEQMAAKLRSQGHAGSVVPK